MSLNPNLGHGMNMKRILQTRRRPRKRVQRSSRSMSTRSTIVMLSFIPTQRIPNQLLRIRIPICLPPPLPGLHSHRHDSGRMPTPFPVNRRPVVQNLHAIIAGIEVRTCIGAAGESVDILCLPPRVSAPIRIRQCTAAGCKGVGIRLGMRMAILIRRGDSRSESTEEGRVSWYTS